MEQEIPNEGVIRRFMLGKASDEERSEVEQRLMVDNAFYEELSVVEDELIDDFLAGELSPDELETFNSYFLASPDRRTKLNFGRALRKYVSKEKGHAQPVVEGPIRPPAPNETPIQPVIPIAKSDLAPAPSAAADLDAAAEFDSPPSVGDSPEPDANPPSRQAVPMQRPATVKPFFLARALTSPYLRAAAILVVICGAAFGIWRAFFYQSDLDKGLAATRGLYRDHRPFEARISLSTAYIPYAPPRVTRGGEQQQGVNLQQRNAELILEDFASEHPGPESQHALGEFYLLKGELQEAIDNLRKAADSDPKNAQYHSDLGAALLEEGKFEQTMADSTGSSHESSVSPKKDFEEALAQLNLALDLKPSLLEAIFNRALVYQALMQRDQARADWRRYLGKDPTSGWAIEARKHLDELDK
jgi:hypothetical protein